ncbi:MAG: serine hydrolase [Chitinophagaceae bacterium]
MKQGRDVAIPIQGSPFFAAIIEIVSGKSYEEYVHTNLFEPAGMKETGYFIPTNLKRVSHGYNDGPTDYGFPWTTQWEGNRPLWDLMGNGGMLSTLDDMYKWAVAIKDDKLVSHKTKDKMFTRYYTAANQAYGWNRAEDPKTKAIYITRYGDAVPQAWNMEYRWYIEQELIFIVLTNKRIRAGSIRRPVMTKLTDIALHNSEAPLFAYKLTGTKETLSKYAGIYKMPSGSLFKVHLNEIPISQNKQISQLLISAQGQDAVDLLYSGNTLKEIAALLKTLNKKTESYISALQNRNKDSLQIFFSGDTIQTALLMWNETENRFGKLKDYTILGTSPLNQSGSQTFIKLYFEKGSGVYKVTWKQGRIWDQDEDRLQPMITTFLRKSNTLFPLTMPFMPQSNNEFIGYDFYKDRKIPIRFSITNNKAKNIIFETPEGEITAQLIPF